VASQVPSLPPRTVKAYASGGVRGCPTLLTDVDGIPWWLRVKVPSLGNSRDNSGGGAGVAHHCYVERRRKVDMGKRLGGPLLALVLVAAACGDDSGGVPLSNQEATTTASTAPTGGTPTPTTAPSSEVTPFDVATAIVDIHGPDAGFAATLYALDAGYRTAQIATAATSGTLAVDGSITGVAPEGPRQGVVVPPGLAGNAWTPGPGVVAAGLLAAPRVVLAVTGDTHTPDEVVTEFRDAMNLWEAEQFITVGGFLGVSPSGQEPTDPEVPGEEEEALDAKFGIGLVMFLADMGYRLDDAINGWLFGDWDMDFVPVENLEATGASDEYGRGMGEQLCLVLRDENGAIVRPAGTGSGVFARSRFCAAAIEAGTLFGDVEAGQEPTDDDTTAEEPTQTGDGEDDGGTVDGEYSGVFNWSAWGYLWASFSQNQIDITIEDGEVTALVISIHGVVNLAEDEVITCSGPAGYEADVGPGVLKVDGTSITGDIQMRVYLKTPTGTQCDEADPPFDDVGPMSIDATFDRDEYGDEITGTVIGACEDCDANIPMSFSAWRP